MNEFFRKFAHRVSDVTGSPWAFIVAVTILLIWAVTGPIFHFSDTWQLVINTSTTIVTFMMVFLIQNTQNRDSRALHLKLDEIIRSIAAARNTLIDLEDLSDEDIERIQAEFKRLNELAQANADRNPQMSEVMSRAMRNTLRGADKDE
jgi:low affinity Fe/Cu permease